MAKDYFSADFGDTGHASEGDFFAKDFGGSQATTTQERPINPTGKTSSPADFLPEELAAAQGRPAPNVPGMNFSSYMTQAQPAFKLAIEHPETLTGQAIPPQAIEQSTGGDYADIYRRAALPLPGTQSTNVGGQMIPQIAGGAIDLATRPSTVIGAQAAKVAGPLMQKLATSSPAFRRFLQIQTPNLSKQFLADNPMAPVYKTIQGIPRDITKPLPPNSPKLVKQGQKLVDAVHETMDNLGDQYAKTLEPFYKNKATISGINNADLEAIGINPEKATVQDLWQARWDLLKKVGNPWKKEELLKKTSLNEDQITTLLTRLKANVLNNVDAKARGAITQLDPQFEDAIKAGKGILSSVYNPETGRINTTRLVGIFKNKADQGTQELFSRFGTYDKRVNEVAGAIKSYNRGEFIKNAAGIGVIGVGAEQYLRWQQRQMMDKVFGTGGQR